MQSSAMRNPSSRVASFAAIGAVVLLTATSGAGWSQAQGSTRSRFPNVVLKTHEGKNVRFYDDLLKHKIVMINFFYADCSER